MASTYPSFFAAVFLAFALAASGVDAAESHFQIIPYESGLVGHHDVILLDTQTGETWILGTVDQSSQDGRSGFTQEWFPIEKDKLPFVQWRNQPPPKR
jgi:hypothetical protein